MKKKIEQSSISLFHKLENTVYMIYILDKKARTGSMQEEVKASVGAIFDSYELNSSSIPITDSYSISKSSFVVGLKVILLGVWYRGFIGRRVGAARAYFCDIEIRSRVREMGQYWEIYSEDFRAAFPLRAWPASMMVGKAEAKSRRRRRRRQRRRSRGRGHTNERAGEGSDGERQRWGDTGGVAAAVASTRAGWMKTLSMIPNCITVTTLSLNVINHKLLHYTVFGVGDSLGDMSESARAYFCNIEISSRVREMDFGAAFPLVLL
ncbi:hypothetical protein Scep_013128 [Stephania cephalantha]|uniref:Uncharacterized protein n=1 Tax=Stephania cephalantha TaxID=152367 RepID=A0AAP0PAB2_9MAGN